MTQDQSKMSLGTNRCTSVYTEKSQQKCPFVCRITKTCWFTPLICLFSFSRSPPRRTQKRPTVVRLNIHAVRLGCSTTVSDRISPLSCQDLPLRTYKTMPTGEEWRETCSRVVWVDTLIVSRFLAREVNSKSHAPMTDQQQRLQVSRSIQFKLIYKRCRQLFVTSSSFNASWLENIPT